MRSYAVVRLCASGGCRRAGAGGRVRMCAGAPSCVQGRADTGAQARGRARLCGRVRVHRCRRSGAQVPLCGCRGLCAEVCGGGCAVVRVREWVCGARGRAACGVVACAEVAGWGVRWATWVWSVVSRGNLQVVYQRNEE